MGELKRLCPKCGKANPMGSHWCRACGEYMMSDLPARSEQKLPSSWNRMGASLAVGAATLALRVGLDLATSYLEKQMARAQHERVKQERIRSEVPIMEPCWSVSKPEAEPLAKTRGRIWGRRVCGCWRSDGSGDVEVEEMSWEDDGN